MDFRKLFHGYVENRTKEAALAAIMLALFFLARTVLKIRITSILLIDFTAAIVYSASSILSWPYTLVFSLATLYFGSSPFATLAYFFGTQTVFFLSKLVGKKWIPHIVVTGQVSLPLYGLFFHLAGVMEFRVFILSQGLPSLINILTAYFGGLFFWRVFRMFGVVVNGR